MPQLSNASENLKENRKQNFYSSKNRFILSKLKSKEIAEEFIVRKVSELMYAWFTLKGKVKKIRCCPVNQLKLFAVQ